MSSLGIKTDETLRETVQHGNDRYPFQYYLEDIWDFDFHRMDWHWHRELELVYVQEGTARCTIGTEHIDLPAGSGMFINSRVLHCFEADGKTIIPNIVFSPTLLAAENSLLYDKFVRPITTSAAACQVLSDDVPWEHAALMIVRDIMAAQGAADVSELTTVSRLMALWQLLFDHMRLTEAAMQKPDMQQARLRIMLQFIHDRYGRELSLEEIAAAAYIGKSTALHVFQACMGTSPVAYLIQYRLSQATKLLCATQMNVASIAEAVGFPHEGYFCRKFRQYYHMTPNEYRRLRQERPRAGQYAI